MKRLLAKHSPLLILAMLCLVLALLNADFRDPRNLQQVSLRTCAVGVIAIGQVLVILTAGIDLSVGSVAALSGVTAALTMKHFGEMPSPVNPEVMIMDPSGWHVPFGIFVGCMTGLAFGLFNGLLVTKGRIPPFIATLGSMMIARGIVLLLTGATSVFGLPVSLKYLGGAARIESWRARFVNGLYGLFGATPPHNPVPDTTSWWAPVTLTAALAIVFAVVLTFTRFGRALFATGGNLSAARLSGISVDRVRIGAYGLCGLLAGLGGILLVARTSIADPKAAEGMELDTIAACVIGGASLMGGEGGVLGAVAGALIMNVLVNFCNLNNFDPYWQRVLVGALIVALVYYDSARKRRAGILKE